MNQTKNFLFFDSKSKKPKKTTQFQANHSRSLSAKSDLTKNSARNKVTSQKQQSIPLTKKQKEIREAIQHRFRRSKMRDYLIQYRDNKNRESLSDSHSSQMEQFRQMKHLKVVNLKQYNENMVKKQLQEKQKNSLKSRLKIRTDSSLIMKTQGSDKSIQKLKFLKTYLQPQTPTKNQLKLKAKPISNMGNKQQWKFISIQLKQKDFKKSKQSKSKSKEMKINSHRTLTIQKKQKIRMKTTESQWEFVPKLKDLNKLAKKYKF